MPTYEYRCPSGHVFERFDPKVTDKRRLPCPKCGKRAERQISGGTGLVFKGSGFYATDYKRAGAKNEKAEGDSKGDSKPAEKAPSKEAESKPAEKSPSKKDSSSDS
ncbi:MAG: FmdB family zinc ribbon protein [Gemmatimonadales bacterium]